MLVNVFCYKFNTIKKAVLSHNSFVYGGYQEIDDQLILAFLNSFRCSHRS